MNKYNKNGNGNGFLPVWVQAGFMFMAIIILISIVVGGVSYLFMTEPIGFFSCSAIPSALFKKLFGNCCPDLVRNYMANCVFFIIFWFAVGAIIGCIFRKIRRKIC
jgi:hypothetical protein